MATQQKISESKLQQKIGREVEVLVDEVNAERVVARSSADAPEIDGNVFLAPDSNVQAGEFIKVRIDAADEYDLYASAIDE